jgi:hypothetical protein
VKVIRLGRKKSANEKDRIGPRLPARRRAPYRPVASLTACILSLALFSACAIAQQNGRRPSTSSGVEPLLRTDAKVQLEQAHGSLAKATKSFSSSIALCQRRHQPANCFHAAEKTLGHAFRTFGEKLGAISMRSFAQSSVHQLALKDSAVQDALIGLEGSVTADQNTNALFQQTGLGFAVGEFNQEYGGLVTLLLAGSASAPPSVQVHALQLAQTISFQQFDFPPGSTVTVDTERVYGAPSPPSLCTPVSSQPWWAGYDSATFDPSGQGVDSISSHVVIMPDASHATSALRAISVPGYAESCVKPAYDGNFSAGVTPTNGCVSISLANSSIGHLSIAGLPPHALAYRYQVSLRCSGDGNSSTGYADIVYEVVGQVFLQGDFISQADVITPAIEQHAMLAMSTRAQDAISGKS